MALSCAKASPPVVAVSSGGGDDAVGDDDDAAASSSFLQLCIANMSGSGRQQDQDLPCLSDMTRESVMRSWRFKAIVSLPRQAKYARQSSSKDKDCHAWPRNITVTVRPMLPGLHHYKFPDPDIFALLDSSSWRAGTTSTCTLLLGSMEVSGSKLTKLKNL